MGHGDNKQTSSGRFIYRIRCRTRTNIDIVSSSQGFSYRIRQRGGDVGLKMQAGRGVGPARRRRLAMVKSKQARFSLLFSHTLHLDFDLFSLRLLFVREKTKYTSQHAVLSSHHRHVGRLRLCGASPAQPVAQPAAGSALDRRPRGDFAHCLYYL